MIAPKSGKQRGEELKRCRKSRARKAAAKRQADLMAFRIAVGHPDGCEPVNPALLAPSSSYGVPDFVKRGYYLNQPFTCKDCGESEVWTAGQQKWWYEIAKGHVDARAVRCRPCRRKERERSAVHRRKTEEGRIRKATLKAAGKWRTGL